MRCANGKSVYNKIPQMMNSFKLDFAQFTLKRIYQYEICVVKVFKVMNFFLHDIEKHKLSILFSLILV